MPQLNQLHEEYFRGECCLCQFQKVLPLKQNPYFCKVEIPHQNHLKFSFPDFFSASTLSYQALDPNI